MSEDFSEIIAASKVRSLFALAVPLAYPFLLAAGLATSGRNLADYPQLIATGELSLVRQAMGWVCILAFSYLYVPLAIRALRTRPFIGTSTMSLTLPTGATIPIAEIETIALQRSFWQRLMLVRGAKSDIKVSVTLARGLLADMRQALEADPHLKGVTIA